MSISWFDGDDLDIIETITWVTLARLGNRFGLSEKEMDYHLNEVGLKSRQEPSTVAKAYRFCVMMPNMVDDNMVWMWNLKLTSEMLVGIGLQPLSAVEQEARWIAEKLIALDQLENDYQAERLWQQITDDIQHDMISMVDYYVRAGKARRRGLSNEKKENQP